MFVCARGEGFDFARPIGVGLVGSAIELTSVVLRESPESIVFVGSAGSYSIEINILDIFTSHIATQIESSFLMSDSYTPISNKIENVSHETSKFISDERVIVNSSNYITTDSSVAAKMVRGNILLENMEFFSVLSVAQYFNISAFGIFCVTNYCDKNAHRDFLQNKEQAEHRIVAYVRENYEKYF